MKYYYLGDGDDFGRRRDDKGLSYLLAVTRSCRRRLDWIAVMNLSSLCLHRPYVSDGKTRDATMMSKVGLVEIIDRSADE